MTAGYSGKPLTVKLGIKDTSRVLVAGAPDGFALDCPHHTRAGREPYDVLLMFCPSLADLQRGWATAVDRIVVNGALWIAWPKKSSGVSTDLTGNVVREHALAGGLVDVKVCAIDEVWSGLKLVRRLADR
ncbi:MAG: DUF3052 domain-containing protein [Labedaea sp.]